MEWIIVFAILILAFVWFWWPILSDKQARKDSFKAIGIAIKELSFK